MVGIFESNSLFENGGLIVPLRVLQKMMGREGSLTGFVVVVRRARPCVGRGARPADREGGPRRGGGPGAGLHPGGHPDPPGQGDGLGDVVDRRAAGLARRAQHDDDGGLRADRRDRPAPALGWRRPRVLSLILGEALTLGVAGSILGALLGLVGVRAMQLSPTASVFISPDLPPVGARARHAAGRRPEPARGHLPGTPGGRAESDRGAAP